MAQRIGHRFRRSRHALAIRWAARRQIEAATCALAIDQSRIPLTANWQDRDPECDLDYVTTGAREHAVTVAMNNAYAFGGNNASVILKRAG